MVGASSASFFSARTFWPSARASRPWRVCNCMRLIRLVCCQLPSTLKGRFNAIIKRRLKDRVTNNKTTANNNTHKLISILVSPHASNTYPGSTLIKVPSPAPPSNTNKITRSKKRMLYSPTKGSVGVSCKVLINACKAVREPLILGIFTNTLTFFRISI